MNPISNFVDNGNSKRKAAFASALNFYRGKEGEMWYDEIESKKGSGYFEIYLNGYPQQTMFGYLPDKKAPN